MTFAIPSNDTTGAHPAVSISAVRLPGIALAGAASLGAGAVHAGAIGIHAEHPSLAKLFIAASVFQLGWGLVALLRPSRWLAAIGALGNGGLVAAWLTTRLTGVSFVGGLEVRETAQFTDTATALMGLLAAGLALAAALVGWRKTAPARLLLPGLTMAALTIPAMVAGSTHAHASADDHGATTAVVADGIHTEVVADAHAHPADSGPPVSSDTTRSVPPATTHHDQPPQALAPVAYDPTKPIDLSGVPGVTPEQQAAAENLVAVTVVRLPKWSNPADAEAAGFRSIGDGATGTEHYLQWDWINDAIVLDPDFPESLVYEPQPDGTKKLVSAMYMLPSSIALDQAPVLGGALTQWHIHDNLCFTEDPTAPRVAGLTNAQGECPSALKKFPPAAMIHVWITTNPCGPFAALEGVGAGQIVAGEDRLCDRVHGDGP